MIDTIAILFGIGIHYLVLDRRITKLERDLCWLKKYIKNQEENKESK